MSRFCLAPKPLIILPYHTCHCNKGERGTTKYMRANFGCVPRESDNTRDYELCMNCTVKVNFWCKYDRCHTHALQGQSAGTRSGGGATRLCAPPRVSPALPTSSFLLTFPFPPNYRPSINFQTKPLRQGNKTSQSLPTYQSSFNAIQPGQYYTISPSLSWYLVFFIFPRL